MAGRDTLSFLSDEVCPHGGVGYSFIPLRRGVPAGRGGIFLIPLRRGVPEGRGGNQIISISTFLFHTSQ